jgi:hypothetical protein
MDLLVLRRALQRVDDRSINTGLPALGYFDSAMGSAVGTAISSAIVSDTDSCIEFCLGQY